MTYEEFKFKLKELNISFRDFAEITGYSEQALRNLSATGVHDRIVKILTLVEKAKKYDEIVERILPTIK